MNYRYKVLDGDRLKRGKQAAKSPEALRMELHNRGYRVVEIQAAPLSLDIRSRKLSYERLAILFSQLALMTERGLDMVTILELIASQSKKREREVLIQMLEAIQDGKLLSQAFQETGAFPPFVSGMIVSGEAAGQLGRVFKQLSEFFKDEHALRQKLLNAMAYPVLLIITSVAVLHIVLRTVLPIFTDVFSQDGSELPQMTRWLIALSRHMTRFGGVYLVGILVVVLVLIALKNHPRSKGRFYKAAYHLPLLHFIRRDPFQLRFLRTMKMQLDNGVDLLTILKNGQKTEGDPYVSAQIQMATDVLLSGETLAEALEVSRLLKPYHCDLIRLGEASSALPEMLEIAIELEEHRQKTRLGRIAVYIEPALILIMALVVGFIIFSIAIPMFDMVNHF